MPSKNTEKNKDSIKELEKNISPILVVNNSSLKPYVELFEYSPENVFQQPLGKLLGFFEIKEYSDNSAYVVNFLTSVLKKEYYINPKRSIEESFDAALHKVNLALSELAKHGNIEWLGKLNASICVLEKNGAHFSVSGNARMLLWRGTTLTDISEGLASEEVYLHPIKTFMNISSGRLEKNDRLLITSDDLFQIMSQGELKKNFQRLEGEKFIQFLRTACSNQLEMIASIVIDMAEQPKEEKIAAISTKKKDAKNVFSKTAFENTNKSPEIKTSEEFIIENDPKIEYTDKKTGHIYIQGEHNETEKAGKSEMYLEMAKEKIASSWYHTKNITRRRTTLYKKQFSKYLQEAKKRRQQTQLENSEKRRIQEEERRLQEEIRLQQQEELEMQQRLQKELEEFEQTKKIEVEIIPEIEKIITNNTPKKIGDIKKVKKTKPAAIEDNSADIQPLSFAEKLARAKQFQVTNEISSQAEYVEEVVPIHTIIPEESTSKRDFVILKNKIANLFLLFSNNIIPFSKKIISKFLLLSQKIYTDFKNKSNKGTENNSSKGILLPHTSVIKKTFLKLSTQQKIGAICVLLAVFIIPFFIAKWLNNAKPAAVIETKQEIQPDPREILSRNKNIILDAKINTISADQGLLNVVMTNSGPLSITKNAVIMTTANNSSRMFPIPSDSGDALRATYMQDLSLVLILTSNGSILSFSPSVQKYSNNNINLAGLSGESLIGTYLTYLYVLDQKSNTIYRFPRADGGFGEKTKWLKDETSLAEAKDMAIDENIYAIENNSIIKFFKGVKVNISFEQSSTPVHFDKIFTTPEMQFIYVLDIPNTRIVQYDKNGLLIAQFYNENLKNIYSFTVDEKNKIAYLATLLGLISMSLQ